MFERLNESAYRGTSTVKKYHFEDAGRGRTERNLKKVNLLGHPSAKTERWKHGI
jgi:hypothetical protein